MSRLLLLWALLTPSLAHADVVSDVSCHSWEHWEGGHGGDCRFGPRCAASTPSAGGGAAVAPALVLAGALALRRARRRAQYSSPSS